jgi:hypothetical protein
MILNINVTNSQISANDNFVKTVLVNYLSSRGHCFTLSPLPWPLPRRPFLQMEFPIRPPPPSKSAFEMSDPSAWEMKKQHLSISRGSQFPSPTAARLRRSSQKKPASQKSTKHQDWQMDEYLSADSLLNFLSFCNGGHPFILSAFTTWQIISLLF